MLGGAIGARLTTLAIWPSVGASQRRHTTIHRKGLYGTASSEPRAAVVVTGGGAVVVVVVLLVVGVEVVAVGGW